MRLEFLISGPGRGASHHVLRLAFIAATLVMGCKSQGAKPASACTDPTMIDDMEDGDGIICPSGGRHGDWYTVDDGTSTHISPRGAFTQTLIPGGRGTSLSAARMTGYGFTGTGVAMGLHLNGEGPAAQPYDASAYQGVKLWMKSNVEVSINFTLPETLAVGEPGGTCVDGPTEGDCDNHLKYLVLAPNPDDWVEYDIPFSTLGQLPLHGDADGNRIYGTAKWDPARLVGIEFKVVANQTFDVWVDDVQFYACATADCIPTCTDPNEPVACAPTQEHPTGCRSVGTDCSSDFPGRFPGLWGSGPADVWAVGIHSTAASGTVGATEHWDGAVWSAVPNGGAGPLGAVWGSGANDVWAVGDHGAIQHWNGATWSATAGGTARQLRGVWGGGPNDVWIVGFGGTIEHWDGVTWLLVPSGTTRTLSGVWGSGASDVWAVGTSIIEHWDGATWSVAPTEATATLNGVWGSGPNDVWAVGDGILHWNGATWSVVPIIGLPPATANTSHVLAGVTGSALNDAWSVGSGLTVHWDGTAWSVVPSTQGAIISVWSVGPTDVWAAGTTFLGFSPALECAGGPCGPIGR